MLKRIDWVTILLVLMLVGFSLVSIASIMATPFDGSESSLNDFIDKLNLNYVKKQAVNFLVGVAAFLFVIVFDYQVYRPLIKFIYLGNLGLLALLLIIDKTNRGIAAWFVFEAIDRSVQPSELCKISIIMALAIVVSNSMARNDGKFKGFRSIFLALMLCGIPTAMVMVQPDFGTAFVYICIMIVVFFVARIGWGYILAAAGTTAAALPVAYFFLMNKDQQFRIKVFLNPELDLQNYGYNVNQSKLAIGSGQLYGKGYFSSGTLAQLRYVPERHTDFIFAGIAEGLGFIGGMILILTFFILIFRWLWIALHAKDYLGMCLVAGCAGMLLAHVFENIGMTMGLMPVTGIPLPFISYGGSNLLTNMIAVGIVEGVWMRRPSQKITHRA
ncbi:MAG TPA: rod shape-determining protein RodA [Clostridia bacterium]|nr:rod shape-determining protein RodA [Clostridia bacterium]